MKTICPQRTATYKSINQMLMKWNNVHQLQFWVFVCGLFLETIHFTDDNHTISQYSKFVIILMEMDFSWALKTDATFVYFLLERLISSITFNKYYNIYKSLTIAHFFMQVLVIWCSFKIISDVSVLFCFVDLKRCRFKRFFA